MNDRDKIQAAFLNVTADEGIIGNVLNNKEPVSRRSHKLILPAVVSFIAALLLSNGICLAATGETWVGMIYHHIFVVGNGAVEVEIWNDDTGSGISGSPVSEGDGYSVYEDGRTYFVFGDIRTDITEDIANGNYYKYEYTDEEDVKHVILVGEGQFEERGNGIEYISSWMEIFYMPDGHAAAVAQGFTENNPKPAWLQKAKEDYPLYHTDE